MKPAYHTNDRKPHRAPPLFSESDQSWQAYNLPLRSNVLSGFKQKREQKAMEYAFSPLVLQRKLWHSPAKKFGKLQPTGLSGQLRRVTSSRIFHTVECPVIFGPVHMRETLSQGAGHGTKEEAHS
jgi:hypothetical protein